MNLEETKAHWERAGASFRTGGLITPTSRDPYLGHLERENILAFLEPGFRCLEVGCGDASHTLHYANRVHKVWALDVAHNLIELARNRLQQHLVGNVELAVGSVLDVGEIFRRRRFDCVISQRCLIKLPTWEDRKKAVIRIHGLLSDDGLFLLSEGFQDRLDNLNTVRGLLSLHEIKAVDYNRNMCSGEFQAFVGEYFEVLERRHYGTYLFLSRVFHPLVVLPDAPQQDSRLNEAAMAVSKAVSMPDMEKIRYDLFYALRKRRF